MFLHGGFWHLFFNLVVLYFFGGMVEAAWGSRRFLRYYLACGVGGALLHMLLQYDASVVGASGAIFGLYLAAAMLFPDAYVSIYFIFPVKIRYFVIGLAVLQLAQGIAGPSGIAYFAHMGGMLTGLLFFRGEVARWAGSVLGSHRRARPSRPVRVRRTDADRTDNIDSILDKISQKGYDNLTPTEKRILDNYSRQRRNAEE
jgi:membrane associated rhomboid family serine protease